MAYSTTNTYTMKREILTFSQKLSKGLSRPNKKFVADMTYGMLASNSCLLSDVADSLHEDIKKKIPLNVFRVISLTVPLIYYFLII